MKYYRFCEPGYINDTQVTLVTTVSEQDILHSRWTEWKKRMNNFANKHGYTKCEITAENCVIDWVIGNYAWEVTDEVTESMFQRW